MRQPATPTFAVGLTQYKCASPKNSTVLTLTGRNLADSVYIPRSNRTHRAASPRRGTGACKSQNHSGRTTDGKRHDAA
jgi:hypothetical protein